MFSRKLFISIFIVTFLLSLLVSLPASLLGIFVREASQGRLELANCSGTVWHGSALPILHRRGTDAGVLPIHSMQWDVSPWSFFLLQAHITLNWPDEYQPHPVVISISPSQLQISDLYMPLPALLLGELSPYLRPIQLGGRIIIKSDSLKISRNNLQGTLTADWIGASSALSNVTPLGDYHFVVTGSASGADVTLDTTTGALILKGSGQLTTAGWVNFKGYAQSAEGQHEKLGELLRNLGPETAPNQHAFSLIQN
jgi:general secretion pathway protein N